MPIADVLRDMCCSTFARKTATDLAEQYGGDKAGNVVETGFNQLNVEGSATGAGGGFDVSTLLGAFTGKQQGGLQNIMSMVSGGGGDAIKEHIEKKGVDPSLIDGITSMLSKGGGEGGAAGGGGGFDLGTLLHLASSLTKGGGAGGEGAAGGFLHLLSGGAGGGGGQEGSGQGGTMGNIIKILTGLAKSYFNMKSKSSGAQGEAVNAWDAAGAGANADDNKFLQWALQLISSLLFPNKKPKEIVQQGDDDKILDDPGKKTDDGDVKGWVDGHPEIGKMQKDIFDDILDLKDDDDIAAEEDDPAPLIPTPKDFEENCSILDNASILFLNTNLLLDYRKNWRFLYSTKKHDRSLSELVSRISYKGPNIIVVKDTEGRCFGAHSSSSWLDTDGGWVGNGECFLFSLSPKMAIFCSTGKDENFMRLTGDCLALGGKPGNFGLSLGPQLNSGTCHDNIETFDTIRLAGSTSFDIDHVEVWGLGPEPDPNTERSNTQVRKPNLEIRGGQADLADLESQLF